LLISIASASFASLHQPPCRLPKEVWKKFIVAAKACRDKGNIKGGIEFYRKALSEAFDIGLDETAPELITFLEQTLWS
jgi:hypothetical protein